jgi:hypothetical protein
MPVKGCILRDVAWFPGGSVKDTSPMCHSPLRHGLRQATYNNLALGSWSTVSYLFSDRPATRTGPRLSTTRRHARWPPKPRGFSRLLRHFFNYSVSQSVSSNIQAALKFSRCQHKSAELQTFNPLNFTNCSSSLTVTGHLGTSAMSTPPSVERLDYIFHSLYNHVGPNEFCSDLVYLKYFSHIMAAGNKTTVSIYTFPVWNPLI